MVETPNEESNTFNFMQRLTKTNFVVVADPNKIRNVFKKQSSLLSAQPWPTNSTGLINKKKILNFRRTYKLLFSGDFL